MHEESLTRVPLPHGMFTIVDTADAHLVTGGHRWRVNSHGYAIRGGGRARIPAVSMHRLILCAPKGSEVDHINGDKLDNRRSNLRLCAHAENLRNSAPYRNNTSGFKGVTWHTQSCKWRATIKVNYRQISLGLYASAIEAAHAYDEAARAHFGPYARINFPREHEQDARS